MTEPEQESIDPETWVAWDPAAFVHLEKPEAAMVVQAIERDDDGAWCLTLEDGTYRKATDEEVFWIEAWATVGRGRPAWFDPECAGCQAGTLDPLHHDHPPFQEDSPSTLPRHRPPTFKDPEAKVAPRLPKNVFGAPRAIR